MHKILTIITMAVLILIPAIGIGVVMTRKEEPKKIVLETYTGVGSGVYKHGTIVRIVNGQPVVIGHF